MLLLSGVGGLVATDEYEVEFLNAFFSTTKIYQVFVPTNRIQEGEDEPIVEEAQVRELLKS